MDTFAQEALTLSQPRIPSAAERRLTMPFVAVVRNTWREHAPDYALVVVALVALLGSVVLFLSF